MKQKAKILGSGFFLPAKTLSNFDLEKMVETSDAWITERTGIRIRHIAEDNQGSSDLALIAAQSALKDAGITAKELDFILFATATPDMGLPNSACLLQSKLGASQCAALDINAACSGFLYAMSIAKQYVAAGIYKNILVVGAETLTRFTNYKDRETCILFGDGSGAMIVGPAGENEKSEIYCESLSADGSLSDLLTTPGGGYGRVLTPQIVESGQHFVHMKGREIFKNAVRAMAKSSENVLKQQKMTALDIDWVIPHQANTRIIEAVAKYLEVPMEKFIINLEHTGNTSSASIPIAFDEVVKSGKIKRGDIVLLTAFGGGLTSGALLLRY
jgi:3-oxoacyl-[acyl-carrier-protein] synthase-3